MKRIISIVNPRRGAGKTGLAMNIAACLALSEKKTLLVDGDPQGDATACLLSSEAAAGPGFYSLITGQVDGTAVMADTSLDFLKVIPAGADLFRAEQELSPFSDKVYSLSRRIEAMTGDFDYILIDSPSSSGALTVFILTASEAVLIPLPCRSGAPAALEVLLPVVSRVKKLGRSVLTIAGIVLTQCDGWGEARAVFPEEVLAGIESVAMDTVIARSDVLNGNAPHGLPEVMRDVMSAVSESYMALTVELLKRGN